MYIMKVYSIHYTLYTYTHCDKTQILQKLPSEKIICAKNALFFLPKLPLITVILFI